MVSGTSVSIKRNLPGSPLVHVAKNVSGDPAHKKNKRFLTKRRMSKGMPDGFEPKTP